MKNSSILAMCLVGIVGVVSCGDREVLFPTETDGVEATVSSSTGHADHATVSASVGVGAGDVGGSGAGGQTSTGSLIIILPTTTAGTGGDETSSVSSGVGGDSSSGGSGAGGDVSTSSGQGGTGGDSSTSTGQGAGGNSGSTGSSCPGQCDTDCRDALECCLTACGTTDCAQCKFQCECEYKTCEDDCSSCGSGSCHR